MSSPPPAGDDDRPRRTIRARLRRADPWDIAAAVLLSTATLLTAWCGYESTRWSNVSSDLDRDAAVTRTRAARAGETADRQTIADAVAFGAWLEADVLGNARLADELAARFSPELHVAFDAWEQATPVGELSVGTPLEVPEYRLAASADEQRSLGDAARLDAEADRAQDTGDSYVLLAVVYATVLFLVGVAPKFTEQLASRVALVVAAVLLVVAAVITLASPIDVRLGF